MESSLPLTDITLFVIQEQLSGHEVCLYVLGGYRHGDTVMILYRDVSDLIQPARDGIAQYVEFFGNLKMGEHNDEEYILDENWTTFGLLEEGEQFRMGGRTWTKVPLEELRQLFHNKSFSVR